MYEIIFWGVLFIAFVIAESVTAQLICIWFAAGSLVSLVVSLFTDSILLQLIAFIAVSLILLVFTRPLLRKFIHNRHEATNADAFIGKEGYAIEEIDNLHNTGRIMVSGLSWNARSADDSVIPNQSKVSIISIQGVTAFVKALK